MDDVTSHYVLEIVRRIEPILHGNAPEVVGAALAELLSKLLAGHVVLGNPVATTALRANLLREHMRLVRELVKVNEKELGTAALTDVQGGRH